MPHIPNRHLWRWVSQEVVICRIDFSSRFSEPETMTPRGKLGRGVGTLSTAGCMPQFLPGFRVVNPFGLLIYKGSVSALASPVEQGSESLSLHFLACVFCFCPFSVDRPHVKSSLGRRLLLSQFSGGRRPVQHIGHAFWWDRF